MVDAVHDPDAIFDADIIEVIEDVIPIDPLPEPIVVRGAGNVTV